jgi:KH domain
MTPEEAAQRAKEIAARLSGQASTISSEHPSMESSANKDLNTVENGEDNCEKKEEVNGSDGDEENLSNDVATTDVSAVSKKRKRWGMMPTENNGIESAITSTPALDPAAEARAIALAAIAKAIATPAAGNTSSSNTLMLVGNTVFSKPPPKIPPITKRVWVDAASHSMLTTERPAAHFVAYTNRYIPELVVKLNKTIEKDNSSEVANAAPTEHDEDDLLSIEFKGRGANDRPPMLGMPEEPLHVFIRGSKALVEQAEYEIQDLLEQAKTSPVEEDAVNARLAAEGALTTSSAASIQPIPSTTHYRPASVAQLIGQANMPYEHRIAQLQNDSLQTSQLEEVIGVPNGIVGYIIGRGGENIASMQAKTGVKVQIQKEHELVPGTTERQITLQAHSQDALNACRAIIENMVAERIRVLSNSNSNNNSNSNMSKPGLGYSNNNNMMMIGANQMVNLAGGGIDNKPDPVQAALAMGHQLVEVDVPDADVGLVIGKGGGKFIVRKVFSFYFRYI